MNEQATSLNQALLAAMDTYAGRTCFQIKRDGHYRDITYREFQTLTFHLASYFRRQSVSRAAIVADNCLEWMVTYAACLLSGWVVVPLRSSLAPDTLRLILEDWGIGLAVLNNQEHVENLLPGLTSDADCRLPELETILVVDDEDEQGLPPRAASMNAVLAGIPTPTAEEQEAIRSHAARIGPQALASIVYLAGTTGRPRGAVFDHGQTLAALRYMAEWFPLDNDDRAFALMPWSEATSLAVSLHCFLSGVPSALSESYEPVLENMQQTSPTVMLATPYFLERTYEWIMDEEALVPESSQEVFWWAVAKGKEYLAAGPAASPELRQEYARADMTFFSRIRGQIGGRMRRLYSTGASLPQEAASFFEAIGLPVLNIYSLAQVGGFPAVSRPDASRPASCGQIAPGFEVRIAKDGELLVRGETVMREYWRQPEETKQAIDADGWLHSGDVGHLDEDGYLFITGRKKQLMVLSTGRKIVPSVIERMLTESPFVAQAVAFGEGKPYVSAIIMPDIETLADHFRQDQDGEQVTSTSHPKIGALLDQVVGEVNSRLDDWEQVREYRLFDQPLSKAKGELTTSLMNVCRHVVAEHYAAHIEDMYPLSAQPEEKEVAQVQVNPERMRELLEKESLLDAWMADAGIEFLFELAREKQIDPPSMVHICDAAATIAQMESEEKPLSTALIVGDPVHIARVLPPSQIQLLRHDHIRRMREILVTMAKMVDGLVLGYVVDKYGYVRGIHRLEVALDERPNLLLGPHFGHHAAISGQCDAVVFFVRKGGKRVWVFANGELVGRYASGDWSPDNVSHVDEVVARLVEEKGYDLALVQRVLRCAFQMSEENLGAIFLLGDAGFILERSDASKISSFAAFTSVDMDQLSNREVVNFAKQDGAIVVDVQGQLRGCMVFLRPSANTPAEIGPGKGVRHSSAAKMSAEAQCLAVTVSQDGPITVYDCGQRILSL
jgi:long-chain acyl-CoA synthetase